MICYSFHEGFPENWAALRDSWALLVEKQKAKMNSKRISYEEQHLGGFGSSHSESLVCQDTQGGELLEPLAHVDPKIQEYISPSLMKEETTENIEVKKEIAGGRLVVVANQVKQATSAEGHFEFERYLASKSL